MWLSTAAAGFLRVASAEFPARFHDRPEWPREGHPEALARPSRSGPRLWAPPDCESAVPSRVYPNRQSSCGLPPCVTRRFESVRVLLSTDRVAPVLGPCLARLPLHAASSSESVPSRLTPSLTQVMSRDPRLAATRAGWSVSLSCLPRPRPRAGPPCPRRSAARAGPRAIPSRPRPAAWPAALAGPTGATQCRPATLSPSAWSLLSLRAESSARAVARHRIARAAGLRAAPPVRLRSGRRRPASCPKCASRRVTVDNPLRPAGVSH